MQFKVVFILSISMLMMGCGDNTKPKKNDIPLFEKFLAENPISEVSPIVSIASIYKPGDALFNGVLSIQRNLWGNAVKELQPYVDSKDPDAMFWFATITYGSSVNNTPIAREMFMESAELGNPYSALFFSPENYKCKKYFPTDCDEKWVIKAQGIFEEKAKKGDVRGIYYSKILNNPTHDEYINAVIEAAQNDYYYPLVDYANKTVRKNEPNKEMEKLAIKLLQYARYNNFVPAIDLLITNEYKNEQSGSKLKKELDIQGIALGSNDVWKSYVVFSRHNKSYTNNEKYIIAKAADIFNGSIIGLNLVDEPKNERELIEANKKAQQKADEIKKIIFIDGANLQSY